jgi:TolA-binding protein
MNGSSTPSGRGSALAGTGVHRRFLLWALALVGVVLVGRPLSAQPSPESRLFNAAVRAFEDGIYDRAEREFAEFSRSFPASSQGSEAVLYQARAAIKQQRLQPAIELLTGQLGQAGPLADRYRYWLAEAYLQGTNNQAAAETFAQLIKEFPQSTRLLDASYGEALAFFRLKQWAKVIDLLHNPSGTFQKESRARAADELAVRGQLLLAEALLENRQFQAAEGLVEKLAETDLIPEFKWRRQYLLCRIELGGRRAAEALDGTTNLLALAAAAGQRNLQAESFALRGQIFEQVHDLDAAIQAYTNNLVEATPAVHRRQAFLRTIELTLAQDRLEEAASRLEAFLAQSPQDQGTDVALLALGEVHLKQHLVPGTNGLPATLTNRLADATNHLQAALDRFDKLIATCTNSPLLGRAQLSRGWCLWLDGKVAGSRQAFQAATEVLPYSEDLAVARFKLADAQFQQGDFTNALANYRVVVESFASLPRVTNELAEAALYQMLRVSLELGDLVGANDAMSRVLQDHPRSRLGEKGLLLLGQGYTEARRTDDARGVFARFLERAPTSPLRPLVELAVARTFVEEKQWDRAIAHYEGWLRRHGTNALRAEAAFNLAWVQYQAGHETNALNLFTGFLTEFPTNPLAPRAQFWLGSFWYGQKDFVNAEKNFQIVFQNTNWPVTALSYEARMMAGRAAFARQSWKDAAGDDGYFTRLVGDYVSGTDTNCPPELVAEAFFALGDTFVSQEADQAKPLQKFEKARTAFERIPQLFPTSRLVPHAWGRIGDCCLQLAVEDGKFFDQATNAYQKVLSPALKADVGVRSQAEKAIGFVLEEQARLKQAPESTALRKMALDHYLNIVYGQNLSEGEQADPFWLKEAGLAAARVAEELGQWDVAVKIYERLKTCLPTLKAILDKRIEKARELVPPDKG